MLVNEYSLPVLVQKAAMHVANLNNIVTSMQALTASEVPARKIRVLRMARSPGLGLGVLGPLGDRDRSGRVAEPPLETTRLLIILSSQFCVSSSASWPICKGRVHHVPAHA